MKVLITGGTGTLGKELIAQLYPECERIAVYSRDEQKHYQLAKRWPEYPDNKMRFFLGDVRDSTRLHQALHDIDFVIHTAAIKHVPLAEYNPFEAIHTNIIGTENVIKCCHARGIDRMMFISTDKAVDPINLYGATKLCAERLVISGNNCGGCRFSVCRYGNVEGSCGSVAKLWEEQAKAGGPVTLTHADMTRFLFPIEHAASFVIARLKDMRGGEIFVPALKPYRMADKAQAYGVPVKLTGCRPGEKLHETLISKHEGPRTRKYDNYYIIYPESHEWTRDLEMKGKRVADGFTLTSEVV